MVQSHHQHGHDRHLEAGLGFSDNEKATLQASASSVTDQAPARQKRSLTDTVRLRSLVPGLVICLIFGLGFVATTNMPSCLQGSHALGRSSTGDHDIPLRELGIVVKRQDAVDTTDATTPPSNGTGAGKTDQTTTDGINKDTTSTDPPTSSVGGTEPEDTNTDTETGDAGSSTSNGDQGAAPGTTISESQAEPPVSSTTTTTEKQTTEQQPPSSSTDESVSTTTTQEEVNTTSTEEAPIKSLSSKPVESTSTSTSTTEKEAEKTTTTTTTSKAVESTSTEESSSSKAKSTSTKSDDGTFTTNTEVLTSKSSSVTSASLKLSSTTSTARGTTTTELPPETDKEESATNAPFKTTLHRTSSAVRSTITSTEGDGDVVTITSTSWVEVDPPKQTNDDSSDDSDLQDSGLTVRANAGAVVAVGGFVLGLLMV